MYFPYFYARQSELLALASMIDDHRSLENLVPVIEPVLAATPRVNKLLRSYSESGNRLGIVLNPDKHELASPHAVKTWLNETIPIVDANPNLLPVLRCVPGVTHQYVDGFLKRFSQREVALAYSSPTLSDVEISDLAARSNVRFHIIQDRKIGQHSFDLLPRNKLVHINDNFNKLSRNADYRAPEFFTDQHRTFRTGGFAGFGDYCSVGRELSVSGGPAAAVAIHAVYKNPNGDIWVEHFVSDDTDRSVGDTAEKFLQAAAKLVAAAIARPREFGQNFALDEFRRHVSSRHFPNLAKNKELQIAHHICLTLDVVNHVL
ncbi:sce7725 family protein [Comamonas testosteroni]|uniref:Sce7725 family protein n=1 Tax=Comamonas testosteroni (strain DSM 14576 / KF-1) TaxID=399795 RepID=B7WV91_COMTK|nr:sce7725 family protein [Comamonas testosteroni]EED65683.1 conserved hypothetical protein [Comamonas testosteroni KF-1]WQG69082.1 sce7725 family protein [Comamonas testosteroni]